MPVLPGLESERFRGSLVLALFSEWKTQLDLALLAVVDEPEIDALLGEAAETDSLHRLSGETNVCRPNGVDRAACRPQRTVIGGRDRLCQSQCRQEQRGQYESNTQANADVLQGEPARDRPQAFHLNPQPENGSEYDACVLTPSQTISLRREA